MITLKVLFILILFCNTAYSLCINLCICRE